ncbi:hypothetical protein QJQ45_019772 [Haematococcus lacustris]|nr:hypothetical protein QJQ45_019772 [Haematococcus lacustris]
MLSAYRSPMAHNLGRRGSTAPSIATPASWSSFARHRSSPCSKGTWAPKPGPCRRQSRAAGQEPAVLDDVSEQLQALAWEMSTPHGKVMVRALRQQDVAGACVVLTRAFLGTPDAVSFTDASKFVEGMLSSLPKAVTYLARLYPSDPALLPPNQDSRPVGTVTLSLHPDTLQQTPTLPPPPDTAYLSNMAVDTKFRRCGIARALLCVSDQAAAIGGHRQIYLHVRQGDEAALRLYSMSAYQEVARDSFMAAQLKDVRPRILMCKQLHG